MGACEHECASVGPLCSCIGHLSIACVCMHIYRYLCETIWHMCYIVHIGVICMCVHTHGIVHMCTRDVHIRGIHFVSMYMCVTRVCMDVGASVRISLDMQVSKYNCSVHHCFNSETPGKPTSQREKCS